MKLFKNFLLLGATIIVLSSCSSNKTESNENAEDVCVYQLDNESLDFTWTAYKFTNKTGVNGTFNDIKVSTMENPTSFDDMISNVKFEISTSSVFSNEPERDAKISQFFFGTMKNTASITGSIKKLEGNNATISLSLNEMTVDIPGDLTVSGDTVKLHSTVDFKDFGGEAAVKMLNQVCLYQHTGEDGVSVFWDVVDINVRALYKEDCN